MLRDILSDTTLALRTPETQTQYVAQEGFPNIVIDNFLKPAVAEETGNAFPAIDDTRWTNYMHYNEKKYGLNKRDGMPPALRQLIDGLNSQEFVDFLSDITGIKNLKSDPTLEGGGLHQTPAGGFLNIHADFTTHPHQRSWRRRINVLVYYNKNWQDDYGGGLELWTRDMARMFRKVMPVFNRCLIFNTDVDAHHGHPDPLLCPTGVTRKSIALYYFTEEEALPIRRATVYHARPGEGLLKSMFVSLDNKMLSLYNFLKGALGINDDAISKILRWFSKK